MFDCFTDKYSNRRFLHINIHMFYFFAVNNVFKETISLLEFYHLKSFNVYLYLSIILKRKNVIVFDEINN